ncbi:MAG TPA: acyltransferase [Steroidobacteraceae bacterium]|nr:acyltransferase [Steroidobacteraceae bacterium]
MQTRGSTFRGIVTLSLMVVNVVFWVPLLMVVAVAKLLVPLQGWRVVTSRWMIRLAEAWISCNGAIFRSMGVLRLEVEGIADLAQREWYLVVSNHRSWVDILVLQEAFNRRIPFLKFFLKQQLIWVPFLGLAWWALDFPFMKRRSSAYLAQHPEARGQDLAATRKACERFARIPTSVMVFVEGTRFTLAKQAALGSPYRHLLTPRAGGIAFVLSAMGRMLHSVVDVTIAYRESSPSLWDLCCGRLDAVRVHVAERPIEPWTTEGDYTEDPEFRTRFQQWLAAIWSEKDRRLEAMGVTP